MDFGSLGGAGLELLKFSLPVFSAVLVIVLSALAKKAVDKMGLERSERIDNMIDKYVGMGVNAAERVANKRVTGKDLDGRDKLAMATSTVLAELEQSGLKGVGEELIKARIENYLEISKPSVAAPLGTGKAAAALWASNFSLVTKTHCSSTCRCPCSPTRARHRSIVVSDGTMPSSISATETIGGSVDNVQRPAIYLLFCPAAVASVGCGQHAVPRPAASLSDVAS